MTEEDRPRQHPAICRRDLLWGAGGAAVATVVAVAMDSGREPRAPNDESKRQQILSEHEETRRQLDEALLREEGRREAQTILRAPAWTELDLNAFFEGLSGEGFVSMRKALSMGDSGSDAQLATQSGQTHIADIKKKILWYSSNVVEYPFRNSSVPTLNGTMRLSY